MTGESDNAHGGMVRILHTNTHTYYMHTETYFTVATLTEAAVHHRQCVSHLFHLTTTVHSQMTEAERGVREAGRGTEGVGRKEGMQERGMGEVRVSSL